MTTIPAPTDNGQALTMAQRIILKTAVEDGVVRVPFSDPQFDEKQEVTSLLIQMGFLKMQAYTHEVVATDAGRAVLSAQAQAASEPKPDTVAPVRGIDPKARQNVIEIICDNLTDLFNDWLADNLVEDLLTEYDNGFLVTQLTSDISEGISSWVAKIHNSKPLADMVYDFCEEYLEGEDE